MTLQETIQNELTQIGDFGSGQPPQLLSFDVAGGRIECELLALDRLACAFSRLDFETPKLAEASTADLRRIGKTLADRLTYLLEPLALVEIDPDQGAAQLRSSPPQKENRRSTYYELLAIRGGRLSLMRYEKPAGEPRRQVPANVTREVFQRLAADLALAVG